VVHSCNISYKEDVNKIGQGWPRHKHKTISEKSSKKG
jgi:hypothetical protein